MRKNENFETEVDEIKFGELPEEGQKYNYIIVEEQEADFYTLEKHPDQFRDYVNRLHSCLTEGGTISISYGYDLF